MWHPSRWSAHRAVSEMLYIEQGFRRKTAGWYPIDYASIRNLRCEGTNCLKEKKDIAETLKGDFSDVVSALLTGRTTPLTTGNCGLESCMKLIQPIQVNNDYTIYKNSSIYLDALATYAKYKKVKEKLERLAGIFGPINQALMMGSFAVDAGAGIAAGAATTTPGAAAAGGISLAVVAVMISFSMITDKILSDLQDKMEKLYAKAHRFFYVSNPAAILSALYAGGDPNAWNYKIGVWKSFDHKRELNFAIDGSPTPIYAIDFMAKGAFLDPARHTMWDEESEGNTPALMADVINTTIAIGTDLTTKPTPAQVAELEGRQAQETASNLRIYGDEQAAHNNALRKGFDSLPRKDAWERIQKYVGPRGDNATPFNLNTKNFGFAFLKEPETEMILQKAVREDWTNDPEGLKVLLRFIGRHRFVVQRKQEPGYRFWRSILDNTITYAANQTLAAQTQSNTEKNIARSTDELELARAISC